MAALDLPGKLRRHARIASTPEYLHALGLTSGFIDVWYYDVEVGQRGAWTEQKHVDDHDTFLATIDMALTRFRSNYALWFDEDQWCLLSKRTGDTRRYKHREAAEMVAIHNG